MDIRVEVEDTEVVLVLPRPMEYFAFPYQEGHRLGDLLESAARDVPSPPLVINPRQLMEEQSKVKIGRYQDKNVVLFFEHTDRLCFSPEAAKMVSGAIKVTSQDLELLQQKKIRIHYRKNGTILPENLPSPKTTFGPR